jgi:ATP phosphoribosyltransferase regulatory subunit
MISGPAMSETPNPALLPAGLRDVLPPDAAHAADLVHRLRRVFAGYGYDWVEPPLVEFEESLLDGAGAAMAPDTFRLMDPVSQRMMGVRADITVQVARIATTRLAHLPRPLRLAYAGDVLRVKGKQLRPERQFTQIGAELIGAAEATADVEAVLLAVDALMQIGVGRLSVDLTVPTLVPLVLAAQDFASGSRRPAVTRRLRDALDRKDAAAVDEAVRMLGGEGKVFGAIMRASGSADAALAALGALDLPKPARREIERLAVVALELMAARPDVSFTIDATENRGLEYHTGVCFTIFRAGVRGELGLGGRYRAGRLDEARPQEPATGFTLYLDPILRALPAAAAPERIYLPFGAPREAAAKLRAEGHAVVAALAPEPAGDVAAEAKRLGCALRWHEGKIAP